MSIRMVAVELYRVMKQIDRLEKELENLKVGSKERQEAEDMLRQARVERARLQRMISGAKED